MSEIKCPHCGKTFEIDDTGYQEILSHIKEEEINQRVEKELLKAKEDSKKEKEIALLEKEKQSLGERKSLEEKINLLERELEKAKSDSKILVQQAGLEKEKKIQELSLRLEGEKERQKFAVSEAVSDLKEESSKKDIEIERLNSRIAETEKTYIEKIKEKETNYELRLKEKEEEIAHYRDFKAKLSTKAIGESLEQYCLNEFNKIRAIGFPLAYFDKDNDVAIGNTKGDFIYRDYDEEGTEYVSIMFEMKNEMEETSVKHKNEDFFKKLDKDRTEKNCEYAVLVSTLEADNDFYNQGIVDVSYRGYPKMYVIRPQFFIPFISLIKNAALSTIDTKRELLASRRENIDITNFENNLASFQEGFSRNWELAHKRFNEAIEDIDKSIKQLEKTKEALLKSDNNLRIANNKAQDITIRKLTKDSPILREKFKEAKEANKENKD